MSITQVPIRPVALATRVRTYGGLILLLIAGAGLAWFGAGTLRGETTPSGLNFRVLEAGSGPLVGPNDGVLVKYEGRLPDGTVFDDGGGQPVPMIPGQVIPGFSEALQKMQKGGRYKIRIPAPLAYGATPPQGSPIPANADLDFDVEITQLVPNAAQMMRSGPPPGSEGMPGADGMPGGMPPEAGPPAPGQ